MLDAIARFNRERWEDLANAGVKFSRPWLDLDGATARARVDPEGMLGELAGKDVRCLAGGGGQQSVAFALLRARVTVLDLCPIYVDGGGIRFGDPEWTVKRPDGSSTRVRGPREWRHGLGTVANGLIARGLEIRGVWESTTDEPDPEPGTWAHFESIATPWLTRWAARRAGEGGRA